MYSIYSGSADTLVVEAWHLRDGIMWMENYCVSSASLPLLDVVLLGCDKQRNIDHNLMYTRPLPGS